MTPKQQPQASYGAIDITATGGSRSSSGDEQDCDPLLLPVVVGAPSSTTTKTTTSKKPLFPWLKRWIAAVVVSIVLLLALGWHVNDAQDDNKHDDPSSSVDALSSSPVSSGFLGTKRREDAAPSKIWGASSRGPLPTNSWYLNLVSHRASYRPDDSTNAYTVPYSVDTAATSSSMTAGVRVHWPVLQANSNNVQMVDDYKNSLSVGTTAAADHYQVAPHESLSHLGVTLEWHGNDTATKKGATKPLMRSPIVRGMPFVTMQYYNGTLPTLYSYNGLATDSPLLVDGAVEVECGTNLKSNNATTNDTVTVQREVTFHCINSDFTWLIVFSRSVEIRCRMSDGDEKLRDWTMDVVRYNTSATATDDDDQPLTVRVALLNHCTTGKSNIQQHCRTKLTDDKQQLYEHTLRKHAHIFPTNPTLEFEYPSSDGRNATIAMDWKSQNMDVPDDTVHDDGDNELLMFALPHHQDALGLIDDGNSSNSSSSTSLPCFDTFHGRTCLVKGHTWKLSEDMGPPMSFTARRPPEADAIPFLADALSTDIRYQLPNNLFRGAAETYFSGKTLAKFARVIVIADELKKLATASREELELVYDDVDDEALSMAMEAAAGVELPSDDDIRDAVDQLKRGVEIWLNPSKTEAPFVYDESWGGLVNCGCRYEGKEDRGFCNNTFPDCPALVDVNEDFGNGYYNDHHYHLGYHMLAAAVASKFDTEWGVEHFDRVLLYVRDFANPSADDPYFPQFRQKDWFLGSSWASGIVSAENSPHGRNQESSSEAISAYEAVALYGSVMVDSFHKTRTSDKLDAARLVRDAGQLLTATELHATNRYWHVWSSKTHKNTYPEAYKQPVVGMLYETMASFQTWFAPQPVVSYGIQLLPLTAVAEYRDDPEWASILYPLYKNSCLAAGKFCVDNGWSILQAGLLATTGDRQSALDQALVIPSKVFTSQGGVGNSLTNTIWYVSTRKNPVDGGEKQ